MQRIHSIAVIVWREEFLEQDYQNLLTVTSIDIQTFIEYLYIYG